MKRFKYIFLSLILIASIPLNLANAFEGKFITGVGYLLPEKYRRDNENNPLPFGLSFVPMIAYRSRTLNIMGPRVSYTAFGTIVRFNLNVNMAGDNYKANSLDERKTGVHAGASVHAPFLSVRYEQDVSGRHDGNIWRVSLSHRIKFNETYFARVAVTREFLSSKFTDYYYSVKAHETGTFNEYSLGKEQNTVINVNGRMSLDENQSLVLNITHRRLGSSIAASPTIRLKNYNIFGFFWNYAI